MSEPFPERLSQFTPHAGGLDRDALLFTAGRSSARPNRAWQGLSAVLAATQIFTLACMWPRSVDLQSGATQMIAEQAAPERSVVASAPSPGDAEVWTVVQKTDEIPLDDRANENIVFVDSEPALRAFGPPADSILN